MPTTPIVPTPLLEVETVERPEGAAARAVLLGQPAESEPEPWPGAAEAGVDARWLRAHHGCGVTGAVHPTAGGEQQPSWVVGIGSGSERDWRAAGAALIRAAQQPADGDTRTVLRVTVPGWAGAGQCAAFALGAVAASHRYRVTHRAEPQRVQTLQLVPEAGGDLDDLRAAVAHARELGRATALARDLANTPSDIKDPDWLAGTGARAAATVPGLRSTVRDEHWLAEAGFGGVLAVGGGSARPPRLLELSWDPGAEQHLVLVGKGITFDTGGISIKPADGMHMMRTDMSGGAAVVAALVTVARARWPLRVTGLVPCAENHVSGSAYRPGDVVRHVNGTTSEITNTDAEGRLVLADTLAYAVHTLRPTALVDVATLTGAMKVALGLRTGGLFATDGELADRIRAAGSAVGEDWWPMPLSAEHADDVRSEIADLRQAPPGPGGITAALFLREFTGGCRWAHLDIAGPARAEADYDEVNAGGTGFAARTLVELARSAVGYAAPR